MDQQEFSVENEINNEIEILKARVASAILNSEKIVVTKDKSFEEQRDKVEEKIEEEDKVFLEHAKEKKEKDEELDSVFTPGKNEVYTDNPHLYPILLEESYKQFYGQTEVNEEIKQRVLDDLNHELKHYVPGAGHEFRVRFAMRFFTTVDEEGTENNFFQPFINIEGRIRMSVLNDIITAPDDQSRSDQRQAGVIENPTS